MQPLSRRVNPFDLAGLAKEKQELEEQMAQDGFWNDVENANKVNQRIKAIHAKLDKYRKLETTGEDVSTLFDMAEEEDDEETALEAQAELKEFLHKVEEFRIDTMLRGPYDNANAVLSLHAGAGGTEAQDWVSLLYRMYTRYCERKGFVVKELDLLDGEEAGIKSVTFECQGDNAYGYLKAEKGVHRLVRISPFDSSGRRHTSFASLDVTPILDDDAGDIEINPDFIGTLSSARFVFNCSFRPLFLINSAIAFVFRLLFNVVFKFLFSKPKKDTINNELQNTEGGAIQ